MDSSDQVGYSSLPNGLLLRRIYLVLNQKMEEYQEVANSIGSKHRYEVDYLVAGVLVIISDSFHYGKPWPIPWGCIVDADAFGGDHSW